MEKRKKIMSMLVVIIVLGVLFFFYRFTKFTRESLPFSHTQIDRYITDVMKELRVPGLAVAIVKDDKLVFAQGYGVREIGKLELVDATTVFQIGSCTKAFTAATLALLVDEGKITWDDKAQTYLPDLKIYDPYITRELMISDMLSHRSGVEDIGLVYFRSPLSREELVNKLRYFPPRASFREAWVYNNLLYVAAGQIVSAVTGISWDQFLKERIFTPLGMKNSSPTIREMNTHGNFAQPHVMVNNDVVSISMLDLYNVGPAGAMTSTVLDLAQWIRMLLNNGQYEQNIIIKPETMNQLYAPYSIVNKDYPFRLYGFGWGLSDYHSHKVIAHRGGLDGIASIVGFIPDKKLGVVILTNLNLSEAREVIMYYIFDQYLGVKSSVYSLEKQVAKEKEAAEKERQERKKIDDERIAGTHPTLLMNQYSGTYHDNLYGDLIVEYIGDGLRCRFLSFNGVLQHWQNDVFMFDSSVDYPTVGDRFLFKFQIKNNQVSDLLIKIAGNKETLFKKIK